MGYGCRKGNALGCGDIMCVSVSIWYIRRRASGVLMVMCLGNSLFFSGVLIVGHLFQSAAFPCAAKPFVECCVGFLCNKCVVLNV